MNEVEAKILEVVARLNPGPFGALDEYFRRHQGFVDAAVSDFYRDSQFYVAYLDYIEPLREAGLPFCYPRLSLSPDAYMPMTPSTSPWRPRSRRGPQ